MKNLQIETNLKYDYDMTQDYYDENFKILKYGDRNNTSLSLYINYGNLSSDISPDEMFEIEDTQKNINNLKRYLVTDYFYGYQLRGLCIGGLFDLLIENFTHEDFEEVQELLETLDIKFKSNYTLMTTRGYSQGDYAQILINHNEYLKVIGTEFKEENYQGYFNNLFWDAPIFGTINISFNYYVNCVSYSVALEFEYHEISLNDYEIKLNIKSIINQIKEDLKHPLKDEDLEEIEKQLLKIDYDNIDTNSCICA